MANMFKFVLVQSGKQTYQNLQTKDANTMYAIPDTKEIYFGSDLVASQNVEVSTSMPTGAGKEGMIYVVTTGTDKGLYYYDTASSNYVAVMSYSDFVTASSTDTLTNKTIDADDNTISNLELDNFKAGAVQTTVRDAANAVDTAVATEKAVRTELDKKVDAVPGKSLVDDTEIAKLQTVEQGANKYVHPVSGVTAGTYNKLTVDVNGHVTAATAETTIAGLGLTDAYTKSEVDTKVSEVVQGLDWKDAVGTFADIATTYPNPEEGWTVSVKDTNNVYRYDDATATWINLFNAASNLVSASTGGVGGNNGLMSAEMAEKLAGVEVGAQVNQNAYSTVKVGSDTLSAASATDTIEFAGGTDVSVSASTDASGNKKVTIASTYAHPTSGVNAGTYNKVTVDAEGHVTAATAETTLSGLGVTGESQDITAMTGYTKLAAAPAQSAIQATDSLNDAISKLEYRADNMATELSTVLSGKVDKTDIATVIDQNSTHTQVASAKAVYDALAVVRI